MLLIPLNQLQDKVAICLPTPNSLLPIPYSLPQTLNKEFL
jgi:hypothetical protein